MTGSVDVLEGLHAVRLPPPEAEAALADAAAGAALGLLAALILAMTARLIARRRIPERAAMLADLAAARALPPPERLLAQARLLRRLAERRRGGAAHWLDALARRRGAAFFRHGAGAALREGLYRPGVAVDPDVLEREIARLLRRMRA